MRHTTQRRAIGEVCEIIDREPQREKSMAGGTKAFVQESRSFCLQLTSQQAFIQFCKTRASEQTVTLECFAIYRCIFHLNLTQQNDFGSTLSSLYRPKSVTFRLEKRVSQNHWPTFRIDFGTATSSTVWFQTWTIGKAFVTVNPLTSKCTFMRDATAKCEPRQQTITHREDAEIF